MSVIILNKENFDSEVLNEKGLYLVDFYATWCGPCKMVAPIISEISDTYKDKIKVGKVNVDDENDLAIKYKISSIPNLILFKDGEVCKTIVGFRTKEEIEEIINVEL